MRAPSKLIPLPDFAALYAPEIREWVKTRSVKPAEGQIPSEGIAGNKGGNE
jgi:hypothetical protein